MKTATPAAPAAASTHRMHDGRIHWARHDVERLHEAVRTRTSDETIMDVCRAFVAEMQDQVPGLQAQAANARFYLYDSQLPKSKRIADSRRSRAAVRSAHVRLQGRREGKHLVVAPEPRKASLNGAGKPLTELASYIEGLQRQLASETRRADLAERRAERAETRLARVAKLTVA